MAYLFSYLYGPGEELFLRINGQPGACTVTQKLYYTVPQQTGNWQFDTGFQCGMLIKSRYRILITGFVFEKINFSGILIFQQRFQSKFCERILYKCRFPH